MGAAGLLENLLRPVHPRNPAKLNGLHRRHTPRGLILLGLSPEPASTVAPFLARLKTPLEYPTATEAAHTFSAYEVTTVPRRFLIDPSGKIAWPGRDPEAAEGAFMESAAKHSTAAEFALPVTGRQETATPRRPHRADQHAVG